MRYVPHLQHHAVRGGVNNFKYIVKAMQTGYDTVVTKKPKRDIVTENQKHCY